MTYKEFRAWRNKRTADGCWSMMTAMFCVHIIKIKDLKELFEEYTREQIEIVKKGGV